MTSYQLCPFKLPTIMSYQLIDTFTGKVLGVYDTEAEALVYEQRLVHEPGQSRYEIVAPPAPKKVSKKKAVVTEEADVQEESN